jgi:hypothetical protein
MSILTPAASTATPTSTDQRSNGINVAIGATYSPLENGLSVSLWATPDMDDYAYEAVYNAARISLPDAEDNVRTQLAEHNVQVHAFLNEDGPLTAQQRGADWMTRWGCTPHCINEHGAPTEPEWHAGVPVETVHRDIDCCSSDAENARLPFLAVKTVVTNDKPQAYGRKTQVWLDYGRSIGELSPAEGREVLEAMRAFVPLFEIVVEQAERSARDDFEGDPEIARLDQEADYRRAQAITARNRAGKSGAAS